MKNPQGKVEISGKGEVKIVANPPPTKQLENKSKWSKRTILESGNLTKGKQYMERC